MVVGVAELEALTVDEAVHQAGRAVRRSGPYTSALEAVTELWIGDGTVGYIAHADALDGAQAAIIGILRTSALCRRERRHGVDRTAVASHASAKADRQPAVAPPSRLITPLRLT